MRFAYDVSPKIGSLLSRQTVDLEARHYLRLGGSGLLATRIRGFKSWGDYPDFMYFGGNGDLRGYDYLQFVGQNVVYANAELRFPLIEAMLTPIGVLGGVRGVFFAGMGGSYFSGQSTSANQCGTDFGTVTPQGTVTGTTTRVGSFTWLKRGTTQECPITYDPNSGLPVLGKPVPVSGLRLVDSRASYGLGLETFLLGFPVHFDWAWRTLFNKDWEDVLFAADGGSSKFRRPRFALWIGYDF
jgi:outer membrane protein assembly factor BamA